MGKADIPVKQDDLTRCVIPGGSALFFKHEELPIRREDRLEVVAATLPGRKMQRIAKSDDEDDSLTEDEAERIKKFTRTAILVYLRSWTLKQPVPETVDEFLDNTPRDVVRALEAHVNKLLAAQMADGFALTKENLENEDSPTGA
jgi:hypothetical protein